MEELQNEMAKVSHMRNELRELDQQRQDEHRRHNIIIEELNQELTVSQDNYKQLSEAFSQYKEEKEEEIAGLKIDKNTLQTEYDEYKKEYNDNIVSSEELRLALNKLKNEYKLLTLENTTLLDLMAQEKNSKRRNLSCEPDERNNLRIKEFSNSEMNPYDSLPVDQDPMFESEISQQNKYHSVRREKIRAPYTPNVVGPMSPNNEKYNVAKLNLQQDVNLYSQSPILHCSIPKSDGGNRRSKFSVNSSAAWIQTPF